MGPRQRFRMHQKVIRRIENVCGANHEATVKAAHNLLGLTTSHGGPRPVPELLEAPVIAAGPWLGLAPTFPQVAESQGSYELHKPEPVAADPCAASTGTCEASSSSSLQEEVPRTMVVNISAEVDPYVAACEDGKVLVKAPFMTVSVSTSIQPPLSDTAEALPPTRQLNVPLPALEELMFDPVRNKPNGGRCEVSASQHFGLIEISADVGASLRSRTQPLRAVLQLQTSQNEFTSVNFMGEVLGRFSLVPGKRVVSVDLEYKVVCALGGAGSARFSADGRCLEPIVSMPQSQCPQ